MVKKFILVFIHWQSFPVFDFCDVMNVFTLNDDQRLYLHISLFDFVDASSCSHILSPLPSFPFFSSSSIIQRWQLLLSSGSSDPGMLWPSLASLWLPGHGAACSTGPSFAYNSRCGRHWISSVSSEGYKDSGSALQFSAARFALKKTVFSLNPTSSCSPLSFNIILLKDTCRGWTK